LAAAPVAHIFDQDQYGQLARLCSPFYARAAGLEVRASLWPHTAGSIDPVGVCRGYTAPVSEAPDV
jgi:hypothetical protein